MVAGLQWRAAVLAVLLGLLAGCSGGERDGGGAEGGVAGEGAVAKSEVRKEFVILRELAKQHGIQSEAGNEARLEAVERHLRERLESLPDNGRNEEERAIAAEARRIGRALAER